MKKASYPSWDMAGLRARNYDVPKPRAVHAPVGEKHFPPFDLSDGRARSDLSCKSCGMHVCDCARRRDAYFKGSVATGLYLSGRSIRSSRSVERGCAYCDDMSDCIIMHPDDVEVVRATRAAEFISREQAAGRPVDVGDALQGFNSVTRGRPLSDKPKMRPYPDRGMPLGSIRQSTLPSGEPVVLYNPNSGRARAEAYEVCEDTHSPVPR